MIWILVFVLSITVITIAQANNTSIADKNKIAITPVIQNVKWWISRHKQKVKQIKQGNIDLIMIGDSITHSWEKTGYPIWEKFYGNRNSVNLGFAGDRTEHVIWRLQNGEIDGISPRLAILQIGTNNSGHRQDSANYTAAGINAIIKELRARLPKTKILLLAIFPRLNSESVLSKLNSEVNNIISGYADNKTVFYLNINKRFLDHQGNLSKKIQPDLLHFSESGYQIWAQAMEPMVFTLMNESRNIGDN